MPQRSLHLPSHSRQLSSASSSSESDKLLALPVFRHMNNTQPANLYLRKTLFFSYALLLVSSAVYLGISGYASFWRTSAYIGAVSGLNTVFFSAVLLIACAKVPHPLAQPPSASLGARVSSGLLTISWVISTSLVVAFVVSKSNHKRTWAFAELGTSLLAFVCTLLVLALQLAQYSRYMSAAAKSKGLTLLAEP
ncbi:hypothetical protein NMY22_g9104 [Coprinellus aureogranulatus]|nr:hypothetical protein NMY22_g9104 [Coprinellus aureogranulatus]